MKKHEETTAKLMAAHQTVAPEMVHNLAVSIASFVAELQTSAEVAAYIERRLQPLVGLIRTNEDARLAVERMVHDARKAAGGAR